MASKDNKTSKTARVMNLLSKKPDAGAEEGAPPAPAAPIIPSIAPDAAIAGQIKDALEDALQDELGTRPAAPTQPLAGPAAPTEPLAPPVQAAPPVQPQPAPAPAPQPAPQQPAPAPQPVAQQQPTPAPQPVAQPVEPQPQPIAEVPPRFLPQENPGYINVMQVLVEEKAPKYIKLFGLCNCKRCLEDVKALTLNHLPPKYVVLEHGDMIPRLTVYEGKYASDITAQLLQACKTVMQRPHHNREN